MKLRVPALLAIILGACAHVPATQPRQSELVIDVDDGAVLLRYEPADEAAARQVVRALPFASSGAKRWGALPTPLVITIHPSHAALEAASHRPGFAWLRAWARTHAIELQSPRTWSNGGATDEQMRQLITHELTHVVMFQAIGGDTRLARDIPVWFTEGMATTSAGERFATDRADRRMGELISSGAALTSSTTSAAFASSDEAFRFLARRYGHQRIQLLLARVRNGAGFRDAFLTTMGVSLESFEDELRDHLGQEKTHA